VRKIAAINIIKDTSYFMKNYIAPVGLQVCDESMLLNRPMY